MANEDDERPSDEANDEAATDRTATVEDCSWETVERGDHEFRRKQLGDAAGGEQLGCSLHEVPPGKRAWPYHFHTANEEAAYVLSGEGVLRTPDGETRLSAGSYVAFPTGEDGAHAIRNDGDEPLRYLVVSTMNQPDVLGYPDSEAMGVYAGSPPGGDEDERLFPTFHERSDDVDFWEDVARADEQ